MCYSSNTHTLRPATCIPSVDDEITGRQLGGREGGREREREREGGREGGREGDIYFLSVHLILQAAEDNEECADRLKDIGDMSSGNFSRMTREKNSIKDHEEEMQNGEKVKQKLLPSIPPSTAVTGAKTCNYDCIPIVSIICTFIIIHSTLFDCMSLFSDLYCGGL